MALLKLSHFDPAAARRRILSNYDDQEPYMPGGGYDDREEAYDGDYDDYGPGEAYYGDDYPYEDYADGYGYDGGEYYDDGYGYDDGYDYADGDGYYDDGYGGDYPPEDGEPYYSGELMRYVDENDWVNWLLLILLPPVGIWLLWYRRRYSGAVNGALTALSALWLAAVVAVLILNPFKRPGDTTITPQPVGAVAPLAESEEQGEEETGEENIVVTDEELDESNAVYTVEGVPYYHQSETCGSIPRNSEVTRISRTAAIDQNLMACPYCMAGQYSDGQWDMTFVNAGTEDQSGVKVYWGPYNAHFHVDESCEDLGGKGYFVTLKDALLMSKTACDTCCPKANTQVYCTIDGTYYHKKQTCSGMKNAVSVQMAEARVTGKTRCPKCFGKGDEALAVTPEEAAFVYYVYATPNGTYYHIQPNCSGMMNAQQYSLAEMIAGGRPACPVCCPDAETTVYAEKGGEYYHSFASCSGMTEPISGTLVRAMAAGYQRCPECWTTVAE